MMTGNKLKQGSIYSAERRTNMILGIIMLIFALLILTIAVNLMANFVAPIYALSNLFPKVLNFRRAAFVSALIGSVSDAVASHAHCPVVVVRGETSYPAGAPVIVGADGSAVSQDAVVFAADFASRRGARLIAVNATVEGQTTAHYITDHLAGLDVKITRLAHGVPVGGELDYLDEGTLSAALRARTAI